MYSAQILSTKAILVGAIVGIALLPTQINHVLLTLSHDIGGMILFIIYNN